MTVFSTRIFKRCQCSTFSNRCVQTSCAQTADSIWMKADLSRVALTKSKVSLLLLKRHLRQLRQQPQVGARRRPHTRQRVYFGTELQLSSHSFCTRWLWTPGSTWQCRCGCSSASTTFLSCFTYVVFRQLSFGQKWLDNEGFPNLTKKITHPKGV